MLAGLLLILIIIITIGFQPFTASLIIPSFIRVPALIVLVVTFIAFTLKKRKILFFLVLFFFLSIFLFFSWKASSPNSVSIIVYILLLIALAVTMLKGVKLVPYMMQLLTAFLFFLVITNSILSILSFTSYNLKLIPYQSLRLGGFDFYKYYYNPLLGYINLREFDNGVIGRPCAFMFEPSYLSWFLTTNYFLIDTYTKNDKWKGLVIKPIVFLGALCTFSTGAIVVFGVLFMLKVCKILLIKFSVKKKSANVVIRTLLIVAFIFYFFIPKEQISQYTGNTSYGDRDSRIQVSLLILATSSPRELIFGKAPGYIENNLDKGESNQLIKMLVEEGIILTFCIISYIVFCTKHNNNFMLATLLFLNSVVILWTPLFLLNLIVCKFGWGKDLTFADQVPLYQLEYT